MPVGAPPVMNSVPCAASSLSTSAIRVIETWDELWDAPHEPCGLPSWFGRNLDAWSDTIHTGDISDVLDRHFLRVTVRRAGDCPGDRRRAGRWEHLSKTRPLRRPTVAS
jgi:hypothetical protein